MATPLDNLMSGSLEGLSLSSFESWITIGVNIILSTIIAGAVIAFVALILGKKSGEEVNVGNAFLMSIVVSAINFFGIMGILGGIVPFLAILLPLIVWIVLSKFFFSELSISYIFLIAVLGYGLSMFVVPVLTGSVVAYLPI